MSTPSNENVSDFVHLCVHSDFSLHDGLMKPSEIGASVKEKGMSAVALTDDMFMSGAIKAYKSMPKEGVKPIIGCDLNVRNGESGGYRLRALAMDNNGYKKLSGHLSRAYQEGYGEEKNPQAYVQGSWLRNNNEGLIILSGGREGDIGKMLLMGHEDLARKHALKWKEVLGDRYYFEVSRTGHPDDNKYNRLAVSLAEELDIPVVANNLVRFKEMDDFSTHQYREAIARKISLEEQVANHAYDCSPHQYLKTPEEMAELFSDIPSAVQNTVEIAKRCNIEIELGKNFLPRFDTPNGESEADYINKASYEGLEERLSKILNKDDPDYDKKVSEYMERLDYELGVINQMGFPGYFLIVSDFIKWSKENGVPVGPGRGSGAGSLVAYALKITDIDPIEYDLMFERFLNPERVSMPDFDVDFCQEGRDRVIGYVSDKYGSDSVSQIITFGTFAAKNSLRDVAKKMDKSFAEQNALSKMVPDTVGAKLKDIFDDETNKVIYETEPETKRIIDTALRIEGKTKSVGKHAGGVLIADTKLTDYTPTYNLPDGTGLVSQYDKNDVEDAGLVKFDFLGLKTLTVINKAVKNVNAKNRALGLDPIDIDNIDLKDEKTFKDVLETGNTSSVFQLSSTGMKALIKRLKPKDIYDITAINALYRPGPMDAGMLDQYCDVKNGIKEMELIHPKLEGILKETYGVMVYQEQVMAAAQILAGYTLGGADMLRRAMGKKKPEEMEKQRSIFVEGCGNNGISESEANRVFNLIEKFAGYGFNKSHSVAYAMISMQTAWLKANHPSEFMAAHISLETDKVEKVRKNVNDALDMGINVLPADINKSFGDFTADDEGNILFGLNGIKGFGDPDALIAERKKNGPFADLSDFIIRVNPNKRMLEAGIKAGVFDSFGMTRSTLMESFPQMQADIRKAKTKAKKAGSDADLFANSVLSNFEYIDMPEFNKEKLLADERSVIGLYVTGHPIDKYKDKIEGLVSGQLKDLIPDLDASGEFELTEDEIKALKTKRKVRIAGVITELPDKKRMKSGMPFYIGIDDGTRQLEVLIFPKEFSMYQHLVQEEGVVSIEGTLSYNEKSGKFVLYPSDIQDLDSVVSTSIGRIKINMDENSYTKEKVDALKELLYSAPKGGCGVEISRKVGDKQGSALFDLGQGVLFSEELIEKINNVVGEGSVSVIHRGTPAYENIPTTVIQRSKEEEANTIESKLRLLEQRMNASAIAQGVNI